MAFGHAPDGSRYRPDDLFASSSLNYHIIIIKLRDLFLPTVSASQNFLTEFLKRTFFFFFHDKRNHEYYNNTIADLLAHVMYVVTCRLLTRRRRKKKKKKENHKIIIVDKLLLFPNDVDHTIMCCPSERVRVRHPSQTFVVHIRGSLRMIYGYCGIIIITFKKTAARVYYILCAVTILYYFDRCRRSMIAANRLNYVNSSVGSSIARRRFPEKNIPAPAGRGVTAPPRRRPADDPASPPDTPPGHAE